MSSFAKENPIDVRLAESQRVLCKFPDRVPVIVETHKSLKDINRDKRKYIVPQDLTVGQFVYVIRKRLKLSPEKAMFCFIGHFLPATSNLMNSVYDKYKAKDNFLYVTVSSENTFGSN